MHAGVEHAAKHFAVKFFKISQGTKLSKSFTVVIQHLSTRLIKPNFCFDLPHRRSTTVSLETRNPYNEHGLTNRSVFLNVAIL